MKEGYKRTELGWIPNDWKVYNINNVTYLNPESLGNSTDNNLIINYIDIESVKTGKVLGYKEFGFSEAPSRARRVVTKNDVIISTVRPNLKAIAKIDFDKENLICSTGFAVLRKKEGINSEYLFQFAMSDIFTKQLVDKTVGSNYPAVNSTDIKETLIFVPTLKEQQKIAEILSTVDSQIDNTDKLIEKARELKKGLMQRLLTKGMGHRSFKMTEIGEIPVEWDVKTLEDISANYKNSIVDGPFGSNLKTCDYTEKGILVMQSSYITSGKFELKDVRYISEEKAKELSRSSVKSGDLLMAKIGANFGAVEIIPKEVEYGILSSNSLKIDLNKEIAINKFYLYILKNYRYVGVISKLASVTAQPALSLKSIKELKVAVPSIQEQKKIAYILSSVDTQIEEYENKKSKLEELKKGLMQQLLTGKIRVV